MQAICRNRTVIIIAHRLSSVRRTDRILVMERGQIVESGHHAKLIENPNGPYARLLALQGG
jgi:subfamily B ATP-binding cassette protein HlyB/CyaB